MLLSFFTRGSVNHDSGALKPERSAIDGDFEESRTERGSVSCTSSPPSSPGEPVVLKAPDLSRFGTAPPSPYSSEASPTAAGDVNFSSPVEGDDAGVLSTGEYDDIELDDIDTPKSYALLSDSIILAMCEAGDYRKVRLLVEADEDVNAQDKDGNTALHLATNNGHAEIVRLLLANGACTTRQNILDDTPLHSAARLGFLSIVEMLVEAGASKTAVNDEGDTPLEAARKRGRTEIITALTSAPKGYDGALTQEQ